MTRTTFTIALFASLLAACSGGSSTEDLQDASPTRDMTIARVDLGSITYGGDGGACRTVGQSCSAAMICCGDLLCNSSPNDNNHYCAEPMTFDGGSSDDASTTDDASVPDMTVADLGPDANPLDEPPVCLSAGEGGTEGWYTADHTTLICASPCFTNDGGTRDVARVSDCPTGWYATDTAGCGTDRIIVEYEGASPIKC